ncbi:MAG: dihydrofolate reductase family protein [Brevundimonas sp.]
MTGKVRVDCFSVSVDGFCAGPDQSLEHPLGVGGELLHHWFIPAPKFRTRFDQPAGHKGTDNDFARRGMESVGAWIMGRNMFGPIRGDWADDTWKGWWGEDPGFKVPVIVLTNHPRADVPMRDGTLFQFETRGMEAALERARVLAGDKDIRIGGGAETIRQYLRAGLIDEMHIAISPVVLGRGDPFWKDLDLSALGYEVVSSTAGETATHLVLTRMTEGRT